MTPQLSTLERAPLRKAWRHEAQDIVPETLHAKMLERLLAGREIFVRVSTKQT